MAKTSETTDTLNSLLRGEISAVETYLQAEEKFHNDPDNSSLRQMRDDHKAAANELRQHVRGMGEEPSHKSGAWGAFAKIIEGGAKVFGRTAALKALKEGEEHGVNSYESALNDRGVEPQCQALIRDRLLPRCREHIQTLDRMMERQ
ncbi:MAG: DUF2383 domain-containing protein [Gemmataceae bacterium]